MADIYDFWRVMKPAGIDHVGPLEYPGVYVVRQFRTSEADLLSMPSSSAILAWTARAFPVPASWSDGGFDLRQMRLCDLALTAVVLVAGVMSGLPLPLALALLFVMVDPGYLLFFNSFYADGALFIALFGTSMWLECAGDLLRTLWDSRPAIAISWIAALVLLTLLGGGSKMQYVPLPMLVLAALAPRLVTAGSRAWPRAQGVAVALVIASALVAWNFFLGPGPRFIEFNNYHAVYGGIAPLSGNPERALADLGIPRAYWDLPRTDAWTAHVGLDHPVHRHLRNLSRLRLFELYITDPHAWRGALAASMTQLLEVETHPIGNYERRKGDREPIRRIHQVRWQFSRLSRKVLGAWRPLIGFIVAAVSVWVGAFAWAGRWTGRRNALFFLLLWVLSQPIVAVLGEGLVNLQQHLVGARLGLDFLMVFFAADVVAEVRRRRRGLY